jgi:hypothetical protein
MACADYGLVVVRGLWRSALVFGKQSTDELVFLDKFYLLVCRNVRYEKFPVSVYRKNYTDIIGIPVVFL